MPATGAYEAIACVSWLSDALAGSAEMPLTCVADGALAELAATPLIDHSSPTWPKPAADVMALLLMS